MFKRFVNDHKSHIKLNELQKRLKKQIDEKINLDHYKFESVQCACCNKKDFLQIGEKDRYGLYYPVVVCKKCGLVQTNPRMTQESYNEFYNTEYRRLYGGNYEPEKHFKNKQYPRGEQIYKFLAGNGLLPNKVNPFVIDVGCGAGGTLLYFKEKGWTVKGVDLGEEFINYGKDEYGLDLKTGMIKDLQLSTKPDLIIYSHVLEHILDLNTEINHIANFCKDETLVYIEVPGIKNLEISYRRDLLLYLQNAHVYHFSLTSLQNIFSKQGFTLIKGDESVRGVFKLHADSTFKYVNDFDAIQKYLKKLERKRIIFSLLDLPIKWLRFIKTSLSRP